MSSHDEQVQQRHSNLDGARQARRRDLPAHASSGSTRSRSWSTRYGERTHDELEAEHVDDDHERPDPRDPRRSARRTSWSCPTATPGSRPTSARTRCPQLDFQIFKLLDFGDWVGVEGRLFRTKTNELTIWASRLHFLVEVPAAAAGEVARPDRRRDPLPPALSRSDRQPRLAAGLRDAEPDRLRRSASS